MSNVYGRLSRRAAFQWVLIALAGALLGAPQIVRAQTPNKGIPTQSTKPPGPCCQITGINAATGIVTAKVNATGKTVQFKVKNLQTLRSLKTGQEVSFGRPGSSHTAPKLEEEQELYLNGVDMGSVVESPYPDSGGPGPNPGGPAPGCTTCRNDAFQQLLACKNNANQKYQPGSTQWTSAMQSCQQTYNNAVAQCGCGGSGSAGGGGNACTSCTNSALQQLTACVKAANQQFQQHKSAAAATQLQNDLEACNANYEKAINACPCH